MYLFDQFNINIKIVKNKNNNFSQHTTKGLKLIKVQYFAIILFTEQY